MGRFKHPLHKRPDTHFGRFAINLITIAVLFCLVAFAIMWFLSDSQGNIQTKNLSDKIDNGLVSKIIPDKVRGIFMPKQPGNKCCLFYTNDGRTLMPIAIEIPADLTSTTEKATALIHAMIAGKGAGFMQSTLPKGTTLKSVYLNGKDMIVNLSSEFIDNMTPSIDAEILAVYGIVNTLMLNLDNISSVRLLVENEGIPVGRMDIDLSQPLIGNSALIESQK